MIMESFYLSEEGAMEKAVELTGLCEDEIEEIVGGRFSKQSKWAGLIKGKVEVTENYIFIRTSFGGKTLWRAENGAFDALMAMF